MQKSLKMIRFFILAGIFLTPFLALIVSSSMFFPFITGKNFTFRILVEVVMALWLVLALFDRRYWPKRSWVFLMVAVFTGIIFTSAVFGENFYRSFWSNYERMEGVITYLHLFGLFIVAASVMKTEKIWERFFHVNLSAGVIVGIYGLLQLAGKLATHQGSRLDATLGNATYLAIYMVFNIFLALILFYRSKTNFKWIYLGILFMESTVLYYTATRGAILGIIGGLLISCALMVIFSGSRKIKLTAVFILTSVILLIGGFWLAKDSDFVINSPVLTRFAGISLTEATTESRLTIWKMSWQGFKEKPVFGWGPENYNLVFNKYYEPILWKQEPWFDRAHNVFFDRLTTTGIFGLLSYIGLLGAALYCLWSKRSKAGLSVTDSALFSGMFLAYFFNNLFVFDNIISLVLFFTFLSYIHFKSSLAVPAPEQVRTNLPAKTAVSAGQEFNYNKAALAVLIGGAFIFIIYAANVPAIRASRSIIEAMKTAGTIGPEKGFSNFQKAISLGSFGSMEAREHLSSFAMQIYDHPGSSAEFKKKVQDYTIEQLVKQNEEYPNDIRELVFLAAVYNKNKRYDEGIATIQKAIEISPKKQQLYFELGGAYINKGDAASGLATLKKAFELDQQNTEARKIYAVAAIFAGEETLAEELMKDYGGTITADERFLRAYAQKNDYGKVVAILNLLIANDSGNINYRLNLAQVYFQAGKRAQSIEQIQKIMEINPSFKEQGEKFIDEIKTAKIPQ